MRNLLPIVSDGRWGYCDHRGKVAIQPQYEYAGCFHEGLAVCYVGGHDVIIDQTGSKVGVVDGKTYSHFQEGLLVVESNDRDGYATSSGAFALPPVYDMAWPFVDGMAKVEVDKQVGFIDRTGRFVIPLQEKFIQTFLHGAALTTFESERKWGLVTRWGQEVLGARFKSLWGSDCGAFLACEDREIGIIDATGEWVVPPTYEIAGGGFHHGYANVCKDDRWGVIDGAGNVVLPLKWTYCEGIFEGRIAVYVGGERFPDNILKGGQFGYCDLRGRLVIPAQWDEVAPFEGGIAGVTIWENDTVCRKGYIDWWGNYIWRPTR